MLDRIPLMGVEIDALREPEVVEHVVGAAGRREGGVVITPNLDLLRQRAESPALAPLFSEADLVVADGMPLLWAAQLSGRPLPGRVAGSDLIWSISRAGAAHGLRVFLLGGEPGVAEAAANRLAAAAPGLRVVGTAGAPPGFDRDETQLRGLERDVRAADPQVVFIGLPFPMSQLLAQRLHRRLPQAWFIGVGISLSFVTGDVRRAPALMQRTGTEWLWRLAHEPRRLYRRYLVDGLPFMTRLLAWGLRERLRASSA